jgi:hypothetical protein
VSTPTTNWKDVSNPGKIPDFLDTVRRIEEPIGLRRAKRAVAGDAGRGNGYDRRVRLISGSWIAGSPHRRFGVSFPRSRQLHLHEQSRLRVPGRHPAAMQLHSLPDNGQAQARAAIGSGPGGIHPEERLEDFLQ